MIQNIPTAEGLRDAALRLYFRAWSSVVGLLHDFDAQLGEDVFDLSQDDIYREDRIDFVEAVQEELQTVLTILQQCSELALKARLAEVSPFLLLLNSDVKLPTAGIAADFSDFRTIDAVDLPRAVNSFCTHQLPPSFVEMYHRMRGQRNKFMHLAAASNYLEPQALITDMIELYLALWSERHWLTDRVDYAAVGRNAYFEGKHFSTRLEAMFEMPYTRTLISAAQWKRLFGVKKSAVRYVCYSCADDWAVSRIAPWKGGAELTAYYDPDKGKMHCLMCSGDLDATMDPCCVNGCSSKFTAVLDETFDGVHWCFVCGDSSSREPIE